MKDKVFLKGTLMLAPVPVALVACAHKELGKNLLTIAWCGVDCSDPPIIHVSIRPERYSYRMIEEGGCFTVNLPVSDLLMEVDLCGTVSGREGDKFKRSGLTPIAASKVSAPLVAECPVNIECELRKVVPLGLHTMFLGEIVAKHADAQCIKKGSIDFDELPLIAYVSGEYWSLGKRIGRYGCSGGRV